MPHSLKHAKRLLSELVLPEEAWKALQHPRYWDPRFLTLYLNRCDELVFHDPHVGLKTARIAPGLALLVPEGTHPHDRQEHRERLVRAYATLGGAYRAVGQPQTAEEPYRCALKLAGPISPAARADLYQRLATLRTCQKRYDEAIRLGHEAGTIFRSSGNFGQLACALASQAFAYVEAHRFSEALPVASEGLCYSNPKTNERVHYSLTHNFAYAAAHSNDLDQFGAARSKVREARRLLRHHRRSVPKFKLYWVEGLLLQKLFATKRAEQLFRKARRGFLELEAPYEIALASLDLSGLLHNEGRWAELRTIAAETFERFRELREDTEALAALGLWREAVVNETLDRKLLGSVRETIITTMVRHRGAP